MKLAIFDFDGTLFLKDTLPVLGREWIRQKRSRSRYILIYLSIMPLVLLYRAGLISREKMKYQAIKRFNRLFTKMSREEIKKFFAEAYPYMEKYFNSQIRKEVELSRSEGFHSVLLSGAYAELMKIVARELEIDTVLAAELSFRDGVFDHTGEIAFVDGESKLSLLQKAFVQEEVDWQASRSYADSYSDLAVMEIVGEPVAVNPDFQLYAHARKNAWRVIFS